VIKDAVIRVPPEFFNWTVELVTEVLLIASLKFATTVVPVLTPVAPLNGETDVTVGGVRSPPLPVLKTTSTQ